MTKQWIVQLGLSAGHDVAPWSDDARPSAIACLDYSTASNKDNFYACANGINSGKYAYNNLQDYDGTWYHKFNAKWHMATEAWYMYEREVPMSPVMWRILYRLRRARMARSAKPAK